MFVSKGRTPKLSLYASLYASFMALSLSCRSSDTDDDAKINSIETSHSNLATGTQHDSSQTLKGAENSFDSSSSSRSVSESKNDSKQSEGVVSAVGNFFGSVADSVSSGVSIVTDSVKDAISSGKKKEAQKTNRALTSFYQLGMGGYRRGIEGESEVQLLGDLESTMNFLKDAEFAYTQRPFSDWTQFNFKDFQIIVILKRFQRKGNFIKIKHLEISESVLVEGESYEEDPSCSVNNWVNTTTSFSLLKVKKEAWMKPGTIKGVVSLSEVQGCHGLLSRFPSEDQGSKFPSSVEWQGSVADRGQRVRIFRRTWGEWSDFTDKYCISCKLLESRFGFPEHKLAFLITEPGEGRIHLNRAYRFSGMLFFDLERDNCPVSENSILVTLSKADVESVSTSFDLSKIAITGPWIPLVRQCQSN